MVNLTSGKSVKEKRVELPKEVTTTSIVVQEKTMLPSWKQLLNMEAQAPKLQTTS